MVFPYIILHSFVYKTILKQWFYAFFFFFFVIWLINDRRSFYLIYNTMKSFQAINTKFLLIIDSATFYWIDHILCIKFCSVTSFPFDIFLLTVIGELNLWMESILLVESNLENNPFYEWAHNADNWETIKKPSKWDDVSLWMLALNGSDLMNHNKIDLKYPRTYKFVEITVKTTCH